MNSLHGRVYRLSRQSGFSLLEVLIAIVITSIGLLGLAAMQATGLRNNHSAYQRSQATVLAYDIADRMRSNASFMISYVTPVEVETPIQVTPIDGETPVEEVTPEIDLSGCVSTTGCSAALLAQNDLAEWYADLAAFLPVGTGSITLAGGIYTINVNWDTGSCPAADYNLLYGDLADVATTALSGSECSLGGSGSFAT